MKPSLNIKFNNFNINHNFFVAKGSHQSICGRDLMCQLGIEVSYKKNTIDLINFDELLDNFIK